MNKCARITVIISNVLLNTLLEHLHFLEAKRFYSTFGRSALLNSSESFKDLLKFSDLLNFGVDVIYFYAPLEFETEVMVSIAYKCRLDIPGRGSIFSSHVQILHGNFSDIICNFNKEKLSQETLLQDKKELDSDLKLFTHLMQIHCTLSKGLGDSLTKFLLYEGIVPTITAATGTGLRDQLGLLRITIPKEKELFTLVVGKDEANNVMEKIISWAKLDRPGRGFIWQTPIEKGIINFKTSEKSLGRAAGLEQIISAIDSLKGSLKWRQEHFSSDFLKKRNYFHGKEIFIQLEEGMSSSLSKIMSKIGIKGATIQSLKTLSACLEEDHIVIPQELLRIVLNPQQEAIFFESIPKDFPYHIFELRVLRAFNYIRKK